MMLLYPYFDRRPGCRWYSLPPVLHPIKKRIEKIGPCSLYVVRCLWTIDGGWYVLHLFLPCSTTVALLTTTTPLREEKREGNSLSYLDTKRGMSTVTEPSSSSFIHSFIHWIIPSIGWKTTMISKSKDKEKASRKLQHKNIQVSTSELYFNWMFVISVFFIEKKIKLPFFSPTLKET